MTADTRMAEIAALVGDPARANILEALMGGRALTAGELVQVAGVSAQTTSGHLGKLTSGRLVSCVKQGRYRYYRVATPRVAEMLESIMGVIVELPPRYRPRSKVDDYLRAARTCYDHLAGKLGVDITESLCRRGYLCLTDEGGEVTREGVTFLNGLGIDLAVAFASRRMFCRPCLDWTERKPHLAGSVGAMLTQRCFDLRWIERMKDSRAVLVTPKGRHALRKVFGLGSVI